jgi:hypothetical protein
MSDEWIVQMGVDQLPHGRNQPFYRTVRKDGPEHCKHQVLSPPHGPRLMWRRCSPYRRRAREHHPAGADDRVRLRTPEPVRGARPALLEDGRAARDRARAAGSESGDGVGVPGGWPDGRGVGGGEGRGGMRRLGRKWLGGGADARCWTHCDAVYDVMLVLGVHCRTFISG